MQIYEKIKKKKTMKDSAFVLMGNVFSQLMGFIVIICVSRNLSIVQYGFYSILNNVSSFVTDLADMGINGAITRFVAEYRAAKDEESENAIIRYSFKRKLYNLLAVFCILVICAKPIANIWLHDGDLYYYVYMVIITCTFSLFIGAMRSILQGRQEFGKYFITVIVWNSIWCISIIIMALTDRLTVFSSILAGAISGLVNLIVCSNFIKINLEYRKIKIRDDIKRKFNTFGFWTALWAVCAILQSKMDVFLLATLTTTEQVSYYDIASKLTKPVLMVASAYAQVLNPQFATIKSKLDISIRMKNLKKYIVIVTGLIVICILAVKPAVYIVFGTKYDNSIIPAMLLLFALIFYVWTIPYNSALYALNKPHVYSIAALLGVLFTIVGDYLLLGSYGAIGASITFIFAQIIGLIVAFISYKIYSKDIKNE